MQRGKNYSDSFPVEYRKYSSYLCCECTLSHVASMNHSWRQKWRGLSTCYTLISVRDSTTTLLSKLTQSHTHTQVHANSTHPSVIHFVITWMLSTGGNHWSDDRLLFQATCHFSAAANINPSEATTTIISTYEVFKTLFHHTVAVKQIKLHCRLRSTNLRAGTPCWEIWTRPLGDSFNQRRYITVYSCIKIDRYFLEGVYNFLIHKVQK